MLFRSRECSNFIPLITLFSLPGSVISHAQPLWWTGRTPRSPASPAWAGGGRHPGRLQPCREQGGKGREGPLWALLPLSCSRGHPTPAQQETPYLFLPLLLPAARGALFSDLVSSTILQGGVCLLMAMGLLTVTGLLTTMGLLTVTGFATGTGFVTVTRFVTDTGLLMVTGLVTGTGLLTVIGLAIGTDLVTGIGLLTGTGLVTGTALVTGTGLLAVTGLVTGTGRLTVTGLLMPMGLLIVTGLLTPMGLLTPTGRLTGPGLGAGRGRSMWFQIRCFSSWVLEVNEIGRAHV